MSDTGFFQTRAYTSSAQLPLEDVAIVLTATDGTAIAMRLTDRSGRIDPIEIPVPPKAESQSPDPGERPYAQVDLYAYRNGFGPFESKNVQIFSGITTFQDLQLIPLSQLPSGSEDSMDVDTPPQNL